MGKLSLHLPPGAQEVKFFRNLLLGGVRVVNLVNSRKVVCILWTMTKSHQLLR